MTMRINKPFFRKLANTRFFFKPFHVFTRRHERETGRIKGETRECYVCFDHTLRSPEDIMTSIIQQCVNV